MNNLNIRQKFLILGVSISILLLVLAILSLNINDKSYKNLNSVVESFKKTQNIQTSYIEELFTLREIALSLVVAPNEDYKTKTDKKLLPIINRLDIAFSTKLENENALWQSYKKLLLKTREYALNGFDEGAFMNASTVEREEFYELILKLKQIQAREFEISEKKLLNSEKSSILNNYYIFITMFFMAIMMYFLDIFIIKKIIRKIENVKSGLLDFFNYLSNPTQYKNDLYIHDLGTKDEIDLMARAINKEVEIAKQNLDDNYKLINEATLTVRSLKKGEFGKRLELKAKSNELNSLKDVINEMIDDLEGKIQEEIAQRTDQEKLLMQQSKLAAMGEMIGNIAHQWRQPISEISAILMELETVTKFSTLEEKLLLENIKKSNQITEHMSTTISDFQNFFKPSKRKDNFSVLSACKKAVSVINASLVNHSIELNFDIQEDSIIYGYSNEFSHAVLNILSNAKDALVNREVENPYINLSIKTGKKYTVIKIEDNAGGIKLDNLDTIFEPYFTTKHAKQGTGIGLYMTKMIIETSMQGYVNVKNSDKGALFVIKIL